MPARTGAGNRRFQNFEKGCNRSPLPRFIGACACRPFPPMSTLLEEIPVAGARSQAKVGCIPNVSTAQSKSDHELMLRVREGDLDCLGTLFERHHGPLYGFLAKLTSNHAAAEDIAQNVFQRMLKYRHTYRDEGNFTAWMYHLARRCAADHYRKTQAAPTATDPTDLEDHADDAVAADESAATRDEHALLDRALGSLGREDREVLLLSRFHDLSFAEIAGILECSVGAARVRAHRALKTLRENYFQLQKERLT